MATSQLGSLRSASRSLIRAQHLSRTSACITTRSASTHHDSTHAHEGTAPETFNTPFWRNTAIASVFGYIVYRFAPSRESVDGREGSFTSFIRNSLTPSEEWKKRNEGHLLLSMESAAAKQLTESARRPIMARVRYVGKFEDYSPHKQPVGDMVDMSDLNVKSDSHMLKHY